jgi:hypothetical protein
MLKLKTHFVQVPLESVKRMVEEQVRQETSVLRRQRTTKETLAEDDPEPKKQSMAASSTSPQREL